jgi:hypothetical protein
VAAAGGAGPPARSRTRRPGPVRRGRPATRRLAWAPAPSRGRLPPCRPGHPPTARADLHDHPRPLRRRRGPQLGPPAPQLERRASWADHDGQLPIVEGTLIHVGVQHLPGDRDPKPLWLWSSDPDAAAVDLDRLWRVFLRRFDLEHTFRFCKQTLGLTQPRLRSPAQADRWVWLLLAAYTQLRLARGLAADLRRPWERPLPPHQLSPCRVRRGYRRLRRILGTPASAPKPSRPGPGRPKGRTSTPALRHPVGKQQHRPATAQPSQTTEPG